MNKKRVASSFIWKLFERGASQIITMIVQIELARLLAPEDFGALAIMVVFTNIANVFIQKGFASSLIRKKDTSDDDYNTAFVVSEGIAIACIAVLFFAAPVIASFYNNPNITVYLRALSISLVFGALYSIENAVLVRDLKFKVIFIRSIAAAMISGTLGIVSAYFRLGVWALVIQSISQQVILCVVTYFGCNWKPRLHFSRDSFNNIFSFGSKILVAELISIGVEDLRTLIIGKRYTSTDLAYYDRGQYYPAAAMRGLYDTISSVMLPVLSKEQDNKTQLEKNVGTSVILSTYLIFPMFVGLSAVADLFVLIFLTSRWEASIPFLRLFCIYQLAFPVYGIMRQSLYAIGNSTGVLKLEIARGILFISAIIIGCFISPFAIAISTSVALYATTLIYSLYVHKFIRYNIRHVCKCLLVSILQCSIMYLAILLLHGLSLPRMLLLLIDIIVGAGIYLITSILFRNEAFLMLKKYVIMARGSRK